MYSCTVLLAHHMILRARPRSFPSVSERGGFPGPWILSARSVAPYASVHVDVGVSWGYNPLNYCRVGLECLPHVLSRLIFSTNLTSSFLQIIKVLNTQEIWIGLFLDKYKCYVVLSTVIMFPFFLSSKLQKKVYIIGGSALKLVYIIWCTRQGYQHTLYTCSISYWLSLQRHAPGSKEEEGRTKQASEGKNV
jgi:hypothetical protein